MSVNGSGGAAASDRTGVLRVEKPGLLATVQGLPRHGAAPFGVPASGAADSVALRIGNRLAGNEDGTPALEATLVGPTLRFEHDAFVALTGAETGATLDGAPAPRGRTLRVRAGQTLACGPARDGARAYVCVGGLRAPVPRAFPPAPLRAGDVLAFDASHGARERTCDPALLAALFAHDVLRVTPGPQGDWFDAAMRASLAEVPASSSPAAAASPAGGFVVTEQSDRRGLRLAGPPLARAASHASRELVTEGVTPGALQVTPDGAAILLGPDGPTTGGYPKIAHVVTADLHRAGQLKPRDVVRFAWVTYDEARVALGGLAHALEHVVAVARPR